MSFRDDIRGICHEVRSIPGQLEMRPYSVEAVTRVWSGDEPGQGTEQVDREVVTEAGGHPPKVRWLSAEEIAVGGFEAMTAEIGPITPEFSGGGSVIDSLKRKGKGSRALLHFVLTGPEFPCGANFKLKTFTSHRAFQYRMVVERSADS